LDKNSKEVFGFLKEQPCPDIFASAQNFDNSFQ
jgi:hypothetical protein